MEENRCIFCMHEMENESRRCPNCKKAVWEYRWNRRWLRPYTVLKNRYMIGAVLGEGASGITYLAYDTQEQSTAAVKEYFPYGKAFREEGIQAVSAADAEKSEEFISGLNQYETEAERLAGKQHIEGIVEERDYFTENNTGYIVMEYLSGQSLKDYLKESHQIRPETAVNMLEPIMEAALSLHAEGMVHCDISPDNLLFDEDNHLKLIDFGSVRKRDEIGGSKELKDGYAPPEQYTEKEKIGPWTDLYAICAVWYEMVTKRKVPPAPERLKKDLLKMPSEYVRIEAEQEQAVMQGLALEIQRRYFSVENLMTRLLISGEEKSDRIEAVRREWGRLWILLTTQVERNAGKTAEKNKIRRFLKKTAAAGLGIISAIMIAAGGIYIYCQSHPEKVVEYYLKKDRKEAEKEAEYVVENMDCPEYEKDLDYVKNNASSVNKEYTLFTHYELTEKKAEEWGKVSNAEKRFYLKDTTMKKVLDVWMEPEIPEEGETHFQGSVWVYNIKKNKMSVSLLKTKTYIHDRMKVTVESDLNSRRVTQVTFQGGSKVIEESVSELLPFISPQSRLTKEDMREIMKQAGESSAHSTGFPINEKCRIFVSREGMDENGEYSYWVTVSRE